jgi:glyoxylase-like metal-dependent hydrolase (beta-lactamase superfamily II)
MFPGVTSDFLEETPGLDPGFHDGETPLLNCHVFAVQAGGKRILVDTGIGNDKVLDVPEWTGMRTPFLERLAAAGFSAESVDLVITTHLHADHVGWNTRRSRDGWVPTFPNARYLVDRREWEHWSTVDDPGTRRMLDESVRPVRDAGLYELLDLPEGGLEVGDGVRLVPAVGHTPGHLAVRLTGGGRSGVITGDSIHTPVQVAHPELSSEIDTDPAAARASRRRLLAGLSGTDDLLLGSHFPTPTAGRVVPAGSGYRLLPEPGVVVG